MTVRLSDFAGIPAVETMTSRTPVLAVSRFAFIWRSTFIPTLWPTPWTAFPLGPRGVPGIHNALLATDPAGPHPNAIEQFFGKHPAALAFVQMPKPIPTSFARESFFAVSAFHFTNAAGKSRYGRYRVVPVAGNEYLDDAAAAKRTPNFLFDEVEARVAREPVRFRVAVQLAQDGDITDDSTVRWPESRQLIPFGEIALTAVAPNNAGEQQRIIFDPIPRVDGIEASADPLFEPRANIYLMSGRRRREADKKPAA